MPVGPSKAQTVLVIWKATCLLLVQWNLDYLQKEIYLLDDAGLFASLGDLRAQYWEMVYD